MPEQLKHIFNAARFQQLAALLAEVSPGFDRRRFLALTLSGLGPLSLLQRMRHGTKALHATLPGNYPAALLVIRDLAPRIEHTFAGMMLPDFVGCFGLDHFDASLDALAHLTRYSSGEFAIREFLRRDLKRTLATMERWSRDENEHVRRLASEGCRPRLPWSFRLDALVADPSPVAPILENLRADPSLYVRKSVANHLNDISKDHPAWMVARLRSWGLDHAHTAWIAKRAARTLIKAGDLAALKLFRFNAKPVVRVRNFRLTRSRLNLGDTLEFSGTIESTARKTQRLVVDYIIHYVKRNGSTAPKVFKLTELDLAPRVSVTVKRRQVLKDFTTRKHHAGRHRVELQINGTIAAGADFTLRTD